MKQKETFLDSEFEEFLNKKFKQKLSKSLLDNDSKMLNSLIDKVLYGEKNHDDYCKDIKSTFLVDWINKCIEDHIYNITRDILNSKRELIYEKIEKRMKDNIVKNDEFFENLSDTISKKMFQNIKYILE